MIPVFSQAHADRRMGLVFDEQLRCYPDPSLPPHAAHAAFHSRLRAIGRDVDERCGGLLHLELAENKVCVGGGRTRILDGILLLLATANGHSTCEPCTRIEQL